MNCGDIRDLIPAYALGSATVEEIHEVELHISSCRDHDAEIMESRQVSALLAYRGPERLPTSDLKTRIMTRATAGENSEAGSVLMDSPPIRRKSGGILGRGVPRSHSLVAVLIVLVGVMIVWNITLQATDQPEKFTHYYWGLDSTWLKVDTVLGDPGAEVSMGGMVRLDDAHKYQLWTRRGEEVLLVGAFNVNPEGRWAGEFEFIFNEGDRLWITTESAAGSAQPTGETVLRTQF